MYLLRRGITWFDGTGGGSGEGQASGDGAGSGTPAGAQNTDRPNAEPTIPLSRFNEVNGRLKKLQEQVEAADREKAQREADAAKAQGEWQKVAEQHEARVKDLEPFKERAERYETALKAHLETARKDLPAHITTLLDRLEPDEQLTWLAENGAALGGQTTARPGTTTNPRPASDPSRKDAVTQARKELAESGRYEL